MLVEQFFLKKNFKQKKKWSVVPRVLETRGVDALLLLVEDYYGPFVGPCGDIGKCKFYPIGFEGVITRTWTRVGVEILICSYFGGMHELVFKIEIYFVFMRMVLLASSSSCELFNIDGSLRFFYLFITLFKRNLNIFL